MEAVFIPATIEETEEVHQEIKKQMRESNVGNPEYKPDRKPYNILLNNCVTFVKRLLQKIKLPNNKSHPVIINPTASNLVDEYYEEGFVKFEYDPSTGSLKVYNHPTKGDFVYKPKSNAKSKSSQQSNGTSNSSQHNTTQTGTQKR